MDVTDRRVIWIVGGFIGITVLCACALVAFASLSVFLAGLSEESGLGFQPDVVALPTVTAALPTPVSLAPAAQVLSTRERLSMVQVPIANPREVTERLAGIPDIPETLASSAAPIPVGTVEEFWIGDVDANENFQINAAMVYATDHAYFWVEEGVRYNLGDVQALVDEFEVKIYPTVREFFGPEWTPGIDGDEHIYIMFAEGLGPSVAGYFNSSDSYSPLVNEYSNGHDMFYISADNVGLQEDFTYGVLAHEFQHMIHWNQDRNEDTWMNEGFAELATLLNDYDVGGFDRSYAGNPDQTLTFWPSDSAGSNYGQAFLFLAYFLERFGSEATQELVSNQANGLDSIDQTLEALNLTDPETGQIITVDDLYLDFAITLLLHDPTLADGRYAYYRYTDAPHARSNEIVSSCETEQAFQVSQYGIDYLRFDCPGSYTLEFNGDDQNRVFPTEPYSGDYAFWSNRGDESDMTLTRAFDLIGVEGPIELEFQMWHDIEEGWDYAYLEVSRDGGETWEILQTSTSTLEDPSGNSFGWAYNGFSGGGPKPEWILETADLSEFAGQKILLRFEYLTDAAVNGEGLVLDDLKISAIGYEEEFETGEGGWEPAGFVRIVNRIPQTFEVALVEKGNEIRIRQIELDELREGKIDFELGEAFDEAFLVVVGTARHSWQPTTYDIRVLENAGP